MFQCRLELGQAPRSVEVPQWMFDAAGRAPRALPGHVVAPIGDSRRTFAGSRPVGPAAGEADHPSFVAGTATANRPSIPGDASGARCRLDDEERVAPCGKPSTDENPEPAVAVTEPWAWHPALQHDQLLTQAQILDDQVRSGFCPRRDRSPRPPDHADPPFHPLDLPGVFHPAWQKERTVDRVLAPYNGWPLHLVYAYLRSPRAPRARPLQLAAEPPPGPAVPAA